MASHLLIQFDGAEACHWRDRTFDYELFSLDRGFAQCSLDHTDKVVCMAIFIGHQLRPRDPSQHIVGFYEIYYFAGSVSYGSCIRKTINHDSIFSGSGFRGAGRAISSLPPESA